MNINKKDVIKLMETIATYLELQGENPFKINAYRKAAQALERDDRSLEEIDNFEKIKGIGKGTSAVIQEYIQTGQSKTLQDLEQQVPKSLLSLLQLPGLGGKKIAKLHQELGITDAKGLKEACESGQVEQLAGFGKKTAEKLIAALEEAGKRPERLPIAIMLPLAEKIENYLGQIDEVERFSRAGSLRRMRETVKDIDFIIATEQPAAVRGALLKMDGIKNVVAKGETKVSIVIEDGYDVNVDFRMVKNEEFASTLHHFTGSKEHNVSMRQLAKARGEKINEYGVENEETGEIFTFDTEEAFFNHFDLHYIPPELRENTGETEVFQSPYPLIELSDIKGDLHMHTTWSDGAQSLEEMVTKAMKKSYQYIAITDHSKFLKVANGLNETRLCKQREEIARLNEKYSDIHIFSGVEMDILPDASLDFSDAFLQEMDFVIASIHSSFNQTEEQIMYRLETALENPYVSLIAHPTGRLIGRRPGYQVNMQKLIEKAKETNTALEINANPNRLDLSYQWAREAQEVGVPLAINTDAHNYQMLEHMAYGVSIARKGWIKQPSVMNTWSTQELIAYLKRNK
ncbi:MULTISPECIES: DNA polymerase/3'-5' exonuclease PolX [Clostridia]|uniref:DNA polymerase/3'-5' exonuclease PolX n=1 Tax=Clostridia TaxID=186801 RepID=UPI000EA27258|nr:MULTISPECIES: DNA polymerase/3'-5' exonuclease PolX [Clostridia]NBJ68952.1 DNA polymerase/3'-5' exonuclease PolX [Roseburia sp. 1XD42-34]RKI79856.1 DNA polymerase/3'-5' exonuclease PolX [Clostridium sp. 1xD42-85]